MTRSLFVLACVASLSGCYAYAEPEPEYAVAEVNAAPVEVDVNTYPHTVYAGRPVYYYRDRWYYRDGQRWYYYRSEPTHLREYRQRGYVQRAPPAR
jgi:hypothetical protein